MDEKQEKARERLKEIFTEVRGLLDEASLLKDGMPPPVGRMVNATIELFNLWEETEPRSNDPSS